MSCIIEYEIEDIGIDHPQYFQGRGVATTRWATVAVGVGSDPLEAFDFALQQLVEEDYTIDEISDNERALYRYASECAGGYTKSKQSFYFESHFNPSDLHGEGCPVLTPMTEHTVDCTCELMYYIAIYVR